MDSPFFKGINPESTGAKVAGPEPSHTGPTGRKPNIQPVCYRHGGPDGPRCRFTGMEVHRRR